MDGDGFGIQEAFNLVVIGITGLFSWLLNMFWANQKENRVNHEALKDKVSDMEVQAASNFVLRQEFTAHMTKIEALLQRIEDKLDGKQDK